LPGEQVVVLRAYRLAAERRQLAGNAAELYEDIFFTHGMWAAERLHPSWASSPNSKRDSTPDHEGRPLGDSVIVAAAIS